MQKKFKKLGGYIEKVKKCGINKSYQLGLICKYPNIDSNVFSINFTNMSFILEAHIEATFIKSQKKYIFMAMGEIGSNKKQSDCENLNNR